MLGAVLGGYGNAGHDKLVIADAGSGIAGFADWAEQLIAESTGKHERGLLPVAVEGTDAPGWVETSDTHLLSLGAAPSDTGTSVSGPLGAQFLVWEFATAVAGRVLRIDPFNQPNVQESKDNTKAVLEKAGDGPLPEGDPLLVDGAIEVHAERALIGDAGSVTEVLNALLAAIPDRGYLAVMAYLDRLADSSAAELRTKLAARLAHPVTFGWGPRFLHSTGQFHKGGPATGVFIQLVHDGDEDIEIPGAGYTFKTLKNAQALGDYNALQAHNLPVTRIRLEGDPVQAVRDLIKEIG